MDIFGKNFDTVFYYISFCCLYYIFVNIIFECNFEWNFSYFHFIIATFRLINKNCLSVDLLISVLYSGDNILHDIVCFTQDIILWK